MVIPAFNEERLIGDCLQSLARQDFTGGHEVIVVDNNCTDDTAEIARLYGAIVVREETPGVCAARHRGTLTARGQIVVSSDADTVFGAGWLSRIAQTFRQLRSRGRIAFDRCNPTLTSARRLTQGLAYNVVVSFLFYYVLAVTLNHATGRAVIGTAPAFRNDRSRPVSRRYRLSGLGWLTVAAAATALTARLMDN
ncbi:glycosyltransferase [Kribbella sp. NBC_00359]|uniref:glycosyltransferase n=1 Tax=Kribbella sp. NBC_00359 TaxID=2975966 RepID=UPI003FA5322C